ncbi:MAG TPA: phosphoglycolate phosphatase [Methylotenera sp.]|nr:phosphoglycolate phosphatase [Methylotenera sp.]
MRLTNNKLNVKAVMIDLDGTLIHTAPEIAWAVNAMLVDIGQSPLAMEQIEAYIGEGANALIKRCLNNELVDKFTGESNAELFVKAQKLFFEHYASVVIKSKPYAGVVEALQGLNGAGYRLACVTNKSESFTLPLLEANDLLQYFELVVSGDTLPKKKPEPDQIFYICEKFGVSVNEAVLVGDSKTDIAAARNAGCYVFVVPYGYNQGYEIAPSSVDALINHLNEVQGLIN